MKLGEVAKCVAEELSTNYSARTNDNELILGVLRRLGVNTDAPFSVVLRAGKLPTSFESITRARRKVQEERPELKDKEAVQIREQRAEEFKDFVRSDLLGL